MNKQAKLKIGFIGQGWIGKNYADNFEDRGFSVTRYSLEHPYKNNASQIAKCDIVFIAVPTPSTVRGFDDSAVRSALKKVGKGKIAVIKSTILPGTTRSIQKQNRGVRVFYSPEFLRESSARYDVDNPDRNIIGVTEESKEHIAAAKKVLKILPKAPYSKICTSDEAEFTKYGGNIFLFWKVIFVNMFYDLAGCFDVDWDTVAENMMSDPRIGKSHMKPIHQMGHLGKTGRGAGGHCFIKDFAAFCEIYEKKIGKDRFGKEILRALEGKNIELLKNSNKDLDLLRQVYGKI